MYPVIILVRTDVTEISILIDNDRIGSDVSLTVNYVTEIVEVMEDIRSDQSVLI